MKTVYKEISDFVICCIEPTIEEITSIWNIMKQTKLKYKIVAIYSKDIFISGNYKDYNLHFIKGVGEDEIEYKGLQVTFLNFFSQAYILLRHEDSFENLKYLIAYYRNNKYDFVMMNEEEKYYDRLFNKIYCIKSPKFTAGSSYSVMSYRFLKLLLSRSKISDFSQQAILLCEQNPEIKANSLNIKGPFSKVSDKTIKRIKLKAFLTSPAFFAFICCLPLLNNVMIKNFNIILISIITLEFLFCYFIFNITKKIYYNRIFFKRRKNKQ